MTIMKSAEIRQFLRERQALLVHFSTPMAVTASRHFPYDLQNASTLTNVPLSFSTIQQGDGNPHETENPAAQGSVGLIVDIDETTEVLQVSHEDLGSYIDPTTGKPMGGGNPPTRQACDDSIDKRISTNEWYGRGFKPAGILVLYPIIVRKPLGMVAGSTVYGEVDIELSDVLSAFPDMRIFNVTATCFLDFDRAQGQWSPVIYDDIIAP